MSQQPILIVIATLLLSRVISFVIYPKLYHRWVKTPYLPYLKHCNDDFLLKKSSSFDDGNENYRKNLKVPLLQSDSFLPLPSSHLPDVLSTLNVYTVPLETALDRTIVEYAKDYTENWIGHVCSIDLKTSQQSWTGTVGCISQILPTNLVETDSQLVCQGSFRFIVKQVLQEIPFPIVLVDELMNDQQIDMTLTKSSLEQDDPPSYQIEYMDPTLLLLEEYCQQQLESVTDVSPLEQVILEETGNAIMPIIVRQLIMEKAAIVQVLRASFFPNVVNNERLDSFFSQPYTIALLAAEITDFSMSQRQTLLEMTNSIQQLKYVYHIVKDNVGMSRARKMAQQITATTDEASKDLKIGTPQLPSWSKSIQKGTQIEYFWNEEYGWCRGVVTENPVLVVDEILLTVQFEDGETHRLPFTADEKVRWRPPSRNG